MINELHAASNLLSVALERYISVCSTIENSSIPRELLDPLSNELSLATSYATKIGHAKLILGRTQNRSALVPISILPTEILSRVFELVLDAQKCGAEEIANIERIRDASCFTKPPDLLSYVCSRWRRVMTTCPKFWTHIDLVPHSSCRSRKRLLTLAKEYVARAGQLPLDFHIIDANSSEFKGWIHDESLFQFLISVGSRMRSLDLVTLSELMPFHTDIFGSLFKEAIPGTLTRLCVSGKPSNYHTSGTFLEATEPSRESGRRLLPKHVLEDLLHPVTVLRLTGLYPYWDSRAYYGLVELRLTLWDDEQPPITKLQLISILTSSPKLRVLELDFGFTEPLPVNISIDPVQLDDLEILNILSMADSQLKTFLPLIAPGSKPLQLALTLPAQALHRSSEEEIYQFLDRANVTKLYVAGPDASLWLGELLDESPQLRALSLRCSAHTEISMPSPYSSDDEFPDPPPRLENLYIHDSHIDLEDLQRLVETYPVHTLTVQRCKVFRNKAAMSDIQGLKNSLAHICPVVRLLAEDERDPTWDWELFDG